MKAVKAEKAEDNFGRCRWQRERTGRGQEDTRRGGQDTDGLVVTLVSSNVPRLSNTVFWQTAGERDSAPRSHLCSTLHTRTPVGIAPHVAYASGTSSEPEFIAYASGTLHALQYCRCGSATVFGVGATSSRERHLRLQPQCSEHSVYAARQNAAVSISL